MYFECQTWDVSQDFVGGETFPTAALAPSAGQLSLPAVCAGSRKYPERGKTFIPHLGLQSYLHRASAETGR